MYISFQRVQVRQSRLQFRYGTFLGKPTQIGERRLTDISVGHHVLLCVGITSHDGHPCGAVMIVERAVRGVDPKLQRIRWSRSSTMDDAPR